MVSLYSGLSGYSGLMGTQGVSPATGIVATGTRIPLNIQEIVPSCVCDLDATLLTSYSGSGQTWSNIITSPADGSAQSTYDMFLGADNAATATDPTFTGSAGTSSAYFLLGGGDYFSNATTISNLIRDMHKDTGGNWWFALAFRFSQNDAFQVIASTAASTAVPGILISSSGTENLQLQQRGDTAGTSSSSGSGVFVNTSDYVIIISRDKTNSFTKRWINTGTGTQASHTYNASTTDTTAFVIGAETDGGSSMPNNTRVYAFSMGNSYITDGQATAVLNEYRRRHQRGYS